MKKILYGYSKRCKRMIEEGVIDLSEYIAVFDADDAKQGIPVGDCLIEKPFYIENSEIIISVKPEYWKEIIAHLLVIGFRKFCVYEYNRNNSLYFEQHLDYSKKDFEKDYKNKILLLLENSSYSNIRAIDYLIKKGKVNIRNLVIDYYCEKNKSYEEYVYNSIVASFILTEHLWEKDVLYSDVPCIQIWHGFPFKAMGNMMTVSDDGFFEDYWKRFYKVISYGKTYTSLMCACNGGVARDYIEIGMPRNDMLFEADGREILDSIFPRARNKKICLYVPTFRQIEEKLNGSEKGYIFYWNGFKIDEFNKFCEEENLFFIFKLHPSDASKLRKWETHEQNVGILNEKVLNEHFFYEILNAVDFLITDYSSVYFDYLLLNRPIIFTNADEEEYINNRGVVLQPLDFWRPGAVVNCVEELQNQIKLIVNGTDTYKKQREQLIYFVYSTVDGNATQRLIDYLADEICVVAK